MLRKAPLALALAVVGVAAIGFVVTSFTATTAKGQEGAEYKGSDKCKACHPVPHAAWMEMKHAHAFASLTAEQIASGVDDKGGTNRKCIDCHTTGYGDGGFVSEAETPKLTNVGCESCHGPGSLHIKTMMAAMMEETEVTDKQISKNVGCAGCHNPHISYKKLYGQE